MLPRQDHLEDAKYLAHKIEIWPQLLTKALAKVLINYERACGQSILNLLRDISGRPSRQLNIKEVTWKFLRDNFKRGSLILAHPDPSFILRYLKAILELY